MNDLMLKIGEIESSVKSAHKRIDEVKALTNSINKLAVAIEKQQSTLESMEKRLERMEERPVLPPCQHTADFTSMQNKLNELSDEFEEIKNKPVKRWDKFVTALITSLAGVIIGYLWGLFK